ncbi:hypothetical protein ACC709_37060, partial [Rhizobium ruizarguesonis]
GLMTKARAAPMPKHVAILSLTANASLKCFSILRAGNGIARPLRCNDVRVPIHLRSIYLAQKHPRRRDSANFQRAALKG